MKESVGDDRLQPPNIEEQQKDVNTFFYSLVMILFYVSFVFCVYCFRAASQDPTVSIDHKIKEKLQHIMYGEMIALAYDVIEKSPHSINEMENFLGCDNEMEPLVECFFEGYEYEGELRACPTSIKGDRFNSFFGYRAYNKKTGDLAIVFRGTTFNVDWGNNIRFSPDTWASSKSSKEPIHIHRGFYSIYKSKDGDGDSLEEVLKSYIGKVAEKAKQGRMNIKTISISGHSLGASIAAIASLGIAEEVKCLRDATFDPEIRVVNFANPAFAGYRFWERLKELNVSYDHYFNIGDWVPTVLVVYIPFFSPYMHNPSKETQHRLQPANEVLQEKKFHVIRYMFGNTVTHSLDHILYNIARDAKLPNRVDVAVFNKAGDVLSAKDFSHVPKKWLSMNTRHISVDKNGTLVEIDVKATECASYRHKYSLEKTFVDHYSRLHKKQCEPDWLRKLKSKDNFD